MGAGVQNSKSVRAEPTDRTTRNFGFDDLEGDGILDAERGFTEGRDDSRVEWVINVHRLSVGLVRGLEG